MALAGPIVIQKKEPDPCHSSAKAQQLILRSIALRRCFGAIKFDALGGRRRMA